MYPVPAAIAAAPFGGPQWLLPYLPADPPPKLSPAHSSIPTPSISSAPAACFAGCVALTNSLSWVSIPTPRLLALIFTLNLYEAALIGLAAYLILVRGLRRDGIMLIILELFFLIDVTFLVSEIATRKSWIGPTIAIITFLAAIVKLAVILRVLGFQHLFAQFAFILIQLATILALPIIFSRHPDGSVSPLAFYISWWIVGLMPVAYEILAKLFPTPTSLSRTITTYTLLPWLSLVGHLSILHYVYDVPFYGAMAAPLLLALAMALNRAQPTRLFSRRDIVVVRTLLPLAALFVSANTPAALTLILDHNGHLILTTLRLTLIATYLEFIYFFACSYWIPGVVVGILIALAAAYGPTLDQLEELDPSRLDSPIHNNPEHPPHHPNWLGCNRSSRRLHLPCPRRSSKPTPIPRVLNPIPSPRACPEFIEG